MTKSVTSPKKGSAKSLVKVRRPNFAKAKVSKPMQIIRRKWKHNYFQKKIDLLNKKLAALENKNAEVENKQQHCEKENDEESQKHDSQ